MYVYTYASLKHCTWGERCTWNVHAFYAKNKRVLDFLAFLRVGRRTHPSTHGTSYGAPHLNPLVQKFTFV